MKADKLTLLFLLLALLSACAPTQTPITGADREAVLAYSEPKSDNLFAAHNAGYYNAFTKDFDPAMLSAMPLSKFIELKKDRDTKVGLYISRQVSDVFSIEGFIVVVYNAKFERVSNVTVRVVFNLNEPHKISGLWFNP